MSELKNKCINACNYTIKVRDYKTETIQEYYKCSGCGHTLPIVSKKLPKKKDNK